MKKFYDRVREMNELMPEGHHARGTGESHHHNVKLPLDTYTYNNP